MVFVPFSPICSEAEGMFVLEGDEVVAVNGTFCEGTKVWDVLGFLRFRKTWLLHDGVRASSALRFTKPPAQRRSGDRPKKYTRQTTAAEEPQAWMQLEQPEQLARNFGFLVQCFDTAGSAYSCVQWEARRKPSYHSLIYLQAAI